MYASRRMFTFTGASVFRNCLRRHSTPVFIFSPKPPITLIKLVSSSWLCFPRYSSLAAEFEANSTSTAATGDDVGTAVILNDQLWPEWVAFLDNLKSKGYFTRNGDDGGIPSDMNSLKTACLSFARDRFDIFKSLSKKEIQAVVDKGCPNLFRKAVNSAKRLRAHLHLNEGDVCNACVLRESCDRAFSELKDFEATARTVDIVRILMLYALDPIGGSVKTPAREAIEVSARKLMTELTELSKTERDPDLVDHDVEVFQQKKQYVSENAENTEMKRGDWKCPQCNFFNFARNVRCCKCGEDGPVPRRVDGQDVEMKKGDWICSKCNYMNFARNIKCLQCDVKGPKTFKFGEKKPGDWDCPKCGFMNFGSNAKCKHCHDPRTPQMPGEWECPECHFWNYSRNASCKKCDHERPK